jgi:hypothetical protein
VVWASGNEFCGFPISNGPITVELPNIQLGAVSSATTPSCEASTRSKYVGEPPR